MTQAFEKLEEAPALGGPCFDRGFFLSVFADRVRAVCQSEGAELPVVLLDLVDGTTLDLCHIEGLGPRWMSAAVFRSMPSCEDMDLIFVPYDTLLRVTVGRRSSGGRALGFNLKKSLPALSERPKEERAP